MRMCINICILKCISHSYSSHIACVRAVGTPPITASPMQQHRASISQASGSKSARGPAPPAAHVGYGFGRKTSRAAPLKGTFTFDVSFELALSVTDSHVVCDSLCCRSIPSWIAGTYSAKALTFA